MSKNLISIIIFFILLAFFVNGFSKSYTSHNISNLAYVLALGIDVGEKAEMKISAQFSKTAVFSSGSGSSSDDSGQIVLVSGESDSIFSGLNLINSYIGKEINLAHCSVVVFSEEIAKKGISSQIYSLINNEEIRPSTNLVISKCSAYNYLDNVKPNLEKLTVQYYDTFSITSRLTGYISDLTIGKFFNQVATNTCDSTAILGGLNATAREELEKKSSNASSGDSSSSGSSGGKSSSSESSSAASEQGSEAALAADTLPKNTVTSPENLTAGSSSVQGKRGTENIGLAVFDDDKLCGELTAMESICHLLIQNNIDSCIISIDNPMENSKKTELNLSPAKKSKVSVDINDNIPHISVKIFLNADILTLEDNMDYESNKVLGKFSKSAKEYMEQEYKKYFNKISKDYGTDIDCFSNKALPHFATISEWNNFNWSEKFKNAEFDISVDIDTISSLLLTGT